MSPASRIRLILASASPRRQQLLQQIGHDPVCVPVDVDETPRPGEDPQSLVRRLAVSKAERYLQHHARSDDFADTDRLLVLGADTVIDLDGAVLGKPRDRDEALQMLTSLSDREHAVHSGVCLLQATGPGLDGLQVRDELGVRTVLRFGRLTQEQAAAYWETGEPAGKAGAYAIQGVGAQFVAWLSGSYSNVVGLPLYETQALLQRAGLGAGSMQ
ncbi:Maf family protein [Granulosicoccus sp. 3-233]|uniref:Maf family protein n=1 Tax=Granulosicoccus sp. 3-233 TaxID=3417969 RepID=UPI003D340CF0